MLNRLRTAAAIITMVLATALGVALIGQAIYEAYTLPCRECGGIESQRGWQGGQPIYICVGG